MQILQKTSDVVTIQFTEQDYIEITNLSPGSATLTTNRVPATPPTPYDAAMDAMESFLMALVSEGVCITTKPFYNAIASAFDAIANNFGDE